MSFGMTGLIGETAGRHALCVGVTDPGSALARCPGRQIEGAASGSRYNFFNAGTTSSAKSRMLARLL